MQSTKFYYLDSAFYLHKRTVKQMLTIVPAAVLNILLNLWLLPEHGYIAAAWSTFASYAVALLITLVYVGGVLRMPLPWGNLVRVVLAAGAMGAAVVYAERIWSPCLVVQIGIGALVYGVAGWFLGVPLIRAIVDAIRVRRRTL